MIALKKSMTIFSAITSFVMTLLLCAAFFFFTKDDEKNLDESNKFIFNQLYAEVHEKLTEPTLVAKTMACDSFLQDFLKSEDDLAKDTEVMKKYLSQIKDAFGFSEADLISARTYRYYRNDSMHKIINPTGDTHDTWFNQFEKDGHLFALNVYKSSRGIDYSSLYLNYCLSDRNGDFLGVASSAVPIRVLTEFFSELEEKFSVKIDILNQDGIVTIDSNYEEIFATSLAHLISYNDGLNYRKTGQGFYASRYMPDFDWYFVVRSTGETEGTADHLKFYLFALAIFCFEVVALFTARKFFRKKEKINLTSRDSIDALTGLPNRNYFKEQFGERGLFNTTVYKCMAVFDIDYFKEANDNLNGNEALLSVVSIMTELLQNNGIILRWGGDEFVVLFTLPVEKSYKICRAFCEKIEEGGLITVSVGLTAINLFDSIKTNYHRAARYCYQVKEIGGNGVKKD